MDYEDTDEYEYDQVDEFYDKYYGDTQYYGDDDYDDEWYEDEYYEPDGYPEPSRLQWEWSRFKNWLRDMRRDPGHYFRRCASCGKRGCVPGEQLCHSDWIPF